MGKDFQGLEIAGPGSLDISRWQLQQNGLSKIAHQEKGSKSAGLSKASGNQTGDPKVSEAATQFEALLLQQMFKSMWSTLPKEEGMLSGSNEEAQFRDMFVEGLANSVAKGQGIGIKEVIAKEMYKTESRAKGNGTVDKE